VSTRELQLECKTRHAWALPLAAASRAINLARITWNAPCCRARLRARRKPKRRCRPVVPGESPRRAPRESNASRDACSKRAERTHVRMASLKSARGVVVTKGRCADFGFRPGQRSPVRRNPSSRIIGSETLAATSLAVRLDFEQPATPVCRHCVSFRVTPGGAADAAGDAASEGRLGGHEPASVARPASLPTGCAGRWFFECKFVNARRRYAERDLLRHMQHPDTAEKVYPKRAVRRNHEAAPRNPSERSNKTAARPRAGATVSRFDRQGICIRRYTTSTIKQGRCRNYAAPARMVPGSQSTSREAPRKHGVERKHNLQGRCTNIRCVLITSFRNSESNQR